MTEQERAADVQRVLQGDADALQRLIIHYHPILRAAVISATPTGKRTSVDADEVLQQTYVAAFKGLSECRFDGPGGFYKWLEAVARSRLRDEQRRDERHRARFVSPTTDASPSASYPDLFARTAGPDSTPSQHVALDELVATMMSCLARLSDDQREVVRLRYLDGRPVAEIAERLDRSEAAIHALCHRGLTALRRYLTPMTRFLMRR